MHLQKCPALVLPSINSLYNVFNCTVADVIDVLNYCRKRPSCNYLLVSSKPRRGENFCGGEFLGRGILPRQFGRGGARRGKFKKISRPGWSGEEFEKILPRRGRPIFRPGQSEPCRGKSRLVGEQGFWSRISMLWRVLYCIVRP